MPVHSLVTQLRFARAEFVRCLEGVSPEDAIRRLMPMNCLSWIVGHLASQEQAFWVLYARGHVVVPGLYELVGFGRPASTPPLDEMWSAWHAVTREADLFLETLTAELLPDHFVFRGKRLPESIGTGLQRNIYHYWFHTGEAHTIRQMLGHADLPQFVGDMSQVAYRPEEVR